MRRAGGWAKEEDEDEEWSSVSDEADGGENEGEDEADESSETGVGALLTPPARVATRTQPSPDARSSMTRSTALRRRAWRPTSHGIGAAEGGEPESQVSGLDRRVAGGRASASGTITTARARSRSPGSDRRTTSRGETPRRCGVDAVVAADERGGDANEGDDEGDLEGDDEGEVKGRSVPAASDAGEDEEEVVDDDGAASEGSEDIVEDEEAVVVVDRGWCVVEGRGGGGGGGGTGRGGAGGAATEVRDPRGATAGRRVRGSSSEAEGSPAGVAELSSADDEVDDDEDEAAAFSRDVAFGSSSSSGRWWWWWCCSSGERS